MADWRVNARVTLSGELSGEYVVDEIFEDGRIVLRPERVRRRSASAPGWNQ